MAYTKPGKPGSRSHMPDSKNGTSMILFNLRKKYIQREQKLRATAESSKIANGKEKY